MTDNKETPDDAAIFAAAVSLYNAANNGESTAGELSDEWSGFDNFMRQLLPVARKFEEWACSQVDFFELNDVWPYLLEDSFGKAFLSVLSTDELKGGFKDTHCQRIAEVMGLPLFAPVA